MQEGDLTQDLILTMDKLLVGAVTLKHSDRFNKAILDLSVTWKHLTTWIEVKFYNEEPFKSPPLQVIRAQQLALQGVCFYVIYELRRGERSTYIANPIDIKKWPKLYIMKADGFNHGMVAQYIKQTHIKEGRR